MFIPSSSEKGLMYVRTEYSSLKWDYNPPTFVWVGYQFLKLSFLLPGLCYSDGILHCMT